MAIVSKIQEKFPDLYSEIADRRKSDPILDEICCDFEKLATIIGSPGENTDANEDRLHKDIRTTVQELGDEIRKRLSGSNYQNKEISHTLIFILKTIPLHGLPLLILDCTSTI